jgi:hypothetical protein
MRACSPRRLFRSGDATPIGPETPCPISGVTVFKLVIGHHIDVHLPKTMQPRILPRLFGVIPPVGLYNERVNPICQPRLLADAPARRFDIHPISLANPQAGCCLRMNPHLRMRISLAEETNLSHPLMVRFDDRPSGNK